MVLSHKQGQIIYWFWWDFWARKSKGKKGKDLVQQITSSRRYCLSQTNMGSETSLSFLSCAI